MDNSGLASLFNSYAGTGNPALDAALGIQPLTDEEIAAYQAQLAGLYPPQEPPPEQAYQPQPQGQPQAQIPKNLKGGAAYAAPYVQAAAEKWGVPADLLMAQMQQESQFKAGADSGEVVGWSQFTGPTWERYGKGRDRRDIEAASDAQAHYMHDLYKRFGDWDLALAGYNAGEGAVEKYGRTIPPFKETREYVQKVHGYRGQYSDIGALTAAPQEPQPQQTEFARTANFQPHIVGAGVSKHPISQTRPELQDILSIAAQNSPYDVQFKSGYRPGDKRQHGKHNAIDVQLVDKATGKVLSDYQDPTHFKAYEDFAHTVRSVQQQLHPELNQNLRWGGYFGGGKGKYGALDLMHFDLGGSEKLGMAGGSWEGGLTPQQAKIWGISNSQGMGASRPAPIQQTSAPQEAQIPEGMQAVWLTNGQQLFAPQEFDLATIAKNLQAQGVDEVPVRPFTTPAGQEIQVPFDMPDNVALAHLERSAPDLLKPTAKPQIPAGERSENEGYGAAAASGFRQAAGSIASGLGAEAQELAKKSWMPELVGEAGQQVGAWLQEKGVELKEKAKTYHRPKDMTGFEEKFAYPLAETAGQVGAYAIPYTVPAVGMLAGTASLYGSSMDTLKARAEQEGKKWNPEEARPYALVDTAVNTLGMKLMGPLKSMLGKEAVLGSRKTIMEIADKQGLDAAKQYVGSHLGNIAKQLGITEAAFTSGEVAEQAIERAYAGLPLFDEEALSEYAATAKQVAPLGFVSGVVKGVGARHVKAEAVEHLKEKQAAEEGVAQQQAEAVQREELANVQKAKAAENLAKRQPVEIPPELQGMPYQEAVNFMRMQEEMAALEAESVAEAAPLEETPEVSAEVPTPEAETPTEQKVPSVLNPADVLELNNRSGLRKQLKGLDLNNVEDHPKIDAILQKTSASFSAENSAKLEALMEEVQRANKVEVPAAPDVSGGTQPEIRQEGQGPAVGGEGVRVSGPEVGQAQKVEVPEIKVEAPDVAARPIEAALPAGAGREPSAPKPTGVLRAAEPSGGIVGDVGVIAEGKEAEAVPSGGVDQLALEQPKIRTIEEIRAEADQVRKQALELHNDLETGRPNQQAKLELRTELGKLINRWDNLQTEATAIGKPLELKEAQISNPDKGIRVVNTPDYEAATNARELLTQYKQRGTDPELLKLTDTILKSPHLGSVGVKWVKTGEQIYPEIAQKFNKGAAAMAAWAEGEQPTIYFRSADPSLREDVLVHEAVHAVTEAALKRNPEAAKELRGIAQQVGRSLKEQHGMLHGSKGKDLSDFWKKAVDDDPGELLAYGLTSPSFREELSKYAADGRPLDAFRSEPEKHALRKNKERPDKYFRGQTPKELTLWDKFVDTISRLFGLPSKRKEEFKRQLNEYLDKKAEYEQKVEDYNTLRPLQEKLDTAFKELFKETSEKGVRMAATEVKEAKSTVQKDEEALASAGLAGSIKDKTLGEKMGQFKRDVISEGRQTSFVTEAIDARSALKEGVKDRPSMNGKVLRADLLYSSLDQRGNVIQGAYHDGYAALGADGTVHVVNDKQLSPKHIFQRVGKKDNAAFTNAAVTLRGRTIKKDDRQTLAQANEYLNKADMLEDAAARTKDPKNAKSYNRSAAKLRKIAEKNLEGINYDKGRTNVSDEDIALAERVLANRPDLAREVTNLRESLRKYVDLVRDAGVLTAEQARAFNEYEDYLPLYKSKSAEEFDKMLLDPMEYIEDFVSHAGRGMNTLGGFKKQKHHDHTVYVEENILRHIAFMTSLAAENSARANTCLQMELTGGTKRVPHKNNKTVMFKENGKEVFYEVNDPAVYAAMHAALPLMSPLLKRLKGMTNFARGVMVVNPLFWFRQLVREPLQASMVGKVGMITPLDTLGAIARISAGKSEGYKKLRSKGVIGPVDVMSDPADFIKTAYGEKGLVSRGWSALKHIHEVVDASTRTVVYERAKADGLSKGMDEETASNYATMRARELINFSKQGRSSFFRAMRATTPFFGAALNSMDVMARAAFPKKLGKLSKAEVMEARRNFYSNAATLALYTTAYTLAMSDNDDYLNSSAKRGFWLVPKEGDPDHPFYKIAVNFESGWFTKELPELLTLYNMGLIGKKEALTEGAKGFKELVLPPMPTVFSVEPIIEVMIDHDFYTGGAIDSGRDAHGMAMFRDKKAGELSKLIVKEMEKRGVNFADLSPNQVEHLFKSFFGQMWGLTRAATDAYLYEGPPQVDKSMWGLPISQRHGG